jgi:hypothetical protein
VLDLVARRGALTIRGCGPSGEDQVVRSVREFAELVRRRFGYDLSTEPALARYFTDR